MQNTPKQDNPGSVACYDIWPGHEGVILQSSWANMGSARNNFGTVWLSLSCTLFHALAPNQQIN